MPERRCPEDPESLRSDSWILHWQPDRALAAGSCIGSRIVHWQPDRALAAGSCTGSRIYPAPSDTTGCQTLEIDAQVLGLDLADHIEQVAVENRT